jgi:polar amino acid transport system substrate-binding protein
MKHLILTILALLTLSAPVLAGDKGKESAYDRVMRTQTIRCGYGMWMPILYKDLNSNQLMGFAYDLMEVIGKRLNLKIDWAEETGWGTLVEGLATNRYDMVCVGLANSSGRAKVVDFSTPLFYSPVYLITRKDDTRFDRAEYAMLDDPQYKIAVLEGEMTSIIANQSYPHAKVDAIPQISDYSMLLKEVETKKADVTIVTPETFAEYDLNNPNKLKMIGKENPLSVFPASFGMPINDLAFKRMIDVTIGELMLDGTVERLLKKYEKYPNTFLRVTKPYEVTK